MASDSIQGLCRLANPHHAKLKTLEKIYDLPEGDWINNEGGYGTVILRPQENDPDLQVECAMTYRDGYEDEDEDFEDDEEFLASDLSDAEPGTSDEPIAIDDSALQPETGDDQ
jgi:hypothetical protein